MFRRNHVVIGLMVLCGGSLLSDQSRAGRFFAGPDQKADSVQKAYEVGATQKFSPLAATQKEYDFAPVQKVYSPLGPMQKYGPTQKTIGSSCCCPAYGCIRYQNHPLLKKRCCCCQPAIQTVLLVQDPRHCCCSTEIPVCISACCMGAPQVSSRVGLLGCGYVTYRWCCGFTIKVIFRGSGDIAVHTYGL